MFTALTLAAALSTQELEKYYWDCDTHFEQHGVQTQYLKPCIDILITFTRTFTTDSFREYYDSHYKQEWNKRGYYNEQEQGE